MGDREVIEPSVEHLQRYVLKRHTDFIGHGISEVNENGIKEPSGPDLQLDAVESTGPAITQSQQALDSEKGGVAE